MFRDFSLEMADGNGGCLILNIDMAYRLYVFYNPTFVPIRMAQLTVVSLFNKSISIFDRVIWISHVLSRKILYYPMKRVRKISFCF